MAELVYSVTEAAEALGISRKTMYELLNRADFPKPLKVGRRRLISKARLAEWVDAQTQKESAARVLAHQSGKVEHV